MADPTGYVKDYSFSGFQANNPDDPLPGVQVDGELSSVQTSIATLVAAVKDVRRSDGALKNGSVTLDSMSAGVLAGLANLDEDAAALVDDAIAAVQTNLEADITALDAEKSDVAHTHAATQVTVSAITDLVATTVQAALAELRALGPRTGDFRASLDSAVYDGWVPLNDGTIGKNGSTATTLASAACFPLYNLIYTNCSDVIAPVTGGRGLSAALDFAALKPIALTKALGRALAQAGNGSGLTSRTAGDAIGSETITITQAHLPALTLTTTIAAGQGSHGHTVTAGITVGGAVIGGGGFGPATFNQSLTVDAATLPAMSGTTPTGGSGTALSVVNPRFHLWFFFKL